MTLLSNQPTVATARRMLAGIDLTPFTAADPTVVDDVLADILEASIAWLEEKATTFFDATAVHEVRDGNGTNSMGLFHAPAQVATLVKVELPVLALTRTYTPSEIKLYRDQGRLTIFTYKLGAEAASLYLDQQVYGNIFPKLPLCVTVDYCAGYPRVDSLTAPTLTSYDGTDVVNGLTVLAGDQRDRRDLRVLKRLQRAAALDAAASFLGQLGANPIGLVQSVSFDGFSQSLNPQAYGPQVQAMVAQRDALLAGRSRLYMTSA